MYKITRKIFIITCKKVHTLQKNRVRKKEKKNKRGQN